MLVSGLLGDAFLYNDPLARPPEGPGWDRLITAAQLQRAMDASHRPYAYTGFALAK